MNKYKKKLFSVLASYRVQSCALLYRLAVNNQRSHRIHTEGFSLKKVNEVEGKGANRFAALENLDAEVEINSAWETIRENTKFQPKRV
jgi:hypothetical protein